MRCPLCGGESVTVIAETLRDGEGRVFHCADCDLGFLDPAAQPRDPAAYYAGTYRREHGTAPGRAAAPEEIFATFAPEQEGRVGLLRPHLTPRTRLLEVGCATGHFLAAVKPFCGEVTGLDYNPEHTAFAAARTGCRVLTGGPAEADLPPAAFDVVCAFQTLEHVPEPLGFLAALSRLLTPGGLIAIEVPNLGDPLLSVYRAPRYRSFFYHRAHALYFTPRSLSLVMERAGFAGTVSFRQDYNLANHLHWAFLDAPQPHAKLGLGPARLPGLRDDLAPEVRADLDAWAADADRTYRAVLARHGLTDNLTFLGRKP